MCPRIPLVFLVTRANCWLFFFFFSINNIIWQSCAGLASIHHVKSCLFIYLIPTSLWLCCKWHQTVHSHPSSPYNSWFCGPLTYPFVLFLLPCRTSPDCFVVLNEKTIPCLWLFLFSSSRGFLVIIYMYSLTIQNTWILVQPWSCSVATYPSLSTELLLLLCFFSHQTANFWIRQHLKLACFSQKMHELATEI